MRVVLLTRNFPGSAYTANEINQAYGLHGVVVEKTPVPQPSTLTKVKVFLARSLLYNLLHLLQFFIDRLVSMDKETIRALAARKSSDVFDSSVLVHETDNLNSDDSVSLIASLKPDIIIVIGTRILKKRVFSLATKIAVNVHCGITPCYRGVLGEFYAFANRDYDNIGYTIHQVDAGVDTGAVILQEHVKPELSDSWATLRVKNVIRYTEGLKKVLQSIENGSLRTSPHGQAGIQYRGHGPWIKIRTYMRYVTRKYLRINW